MKINETDEYFVVSFFPNAEEVEIEDKTDEKGYKAIIGIQDGHHVIMKVMYNRDIYPLDEEDRRVRGFAEGTKTVLGDYATRVGECPICKRLDANVDKVTEINRLDQYTTRQSPIAKAVPAVQTTELFNTGNPLQDLMVRMMFDTKLNTTGQVATALALDDTALLEKVMPKTIDGVVSLMANLTELSQGKGDIYRSPSEVTEFVKALREGVKQPIDEKNNKKTEMPVFRRASTIIVS